MSEKELTPKVDTALEAQTKAIEAELAKLPSVEEMQKQISELEKKKYELSKLQDIKANFGPGKPGKKMFNLGRLPRGLGRITVNGEAFEGMKMLSHSQYEEWIHARDQRIELENKMRYGEGIADQELRAMSGNAGVTISRTGETAKF